MTPQIQIWKREHDGQWCVCIWNPQVYELEMPSGAYEDVTRFERQREVFPDLPLALDYLQRRFGKHCVCSGTVMEKCDSCHLKECPQAPAHPNSLLATEGQLT